MGVIRFSGRKLREVARVSTTLLSPLDDADVPGWQARVNRDVHELLEADLAASILPVRGINSTVTDHFPRRLVEAYPGWVRRVEHRFGMVERQLRLGVYDRRGNYGPHYEAILKSPYYNDLIIPARAFDAVGITVRAGPARDVVMLILHHDHPRRRKFGRRGLGLLRLLFPAFRSGVEAALRLHHAARDLGRIVDDLDQPVLIASDDGRTVHRSAALERLLERDPQAGIVVAHMDALVRSLAATERAGAPAECARRCRTARGDYVLRGVRAPSSLGGPRLRMVVVEKPGESAGERRMLERCELFGLTSQETRVALLLAERRKNREIAEALFISPHTARHHTESVLRKLGVRSRTDVRATLAGEGAGEDAPQA